MTPPIPALMDIDVPFPQYHFIKKFKQHHEKLESYIPRRIFLLKCKDNGILPNFIQNLTTFIEKRWSLTHGEYDQRYTHKTCSKIGHLLLRTEIELANRNISYHKGHIQKITLKIQHNPNKDIFHKISQNMISKIQKKNSKLK